MCVVKEGVSKRPEAGGTEHYLLQLCFLDDCDLLSDHGQHLNVNPTELIKAGPGTSAVGRGEGADGEWRME